MKSQSMKTKRLSLPGWATRIGAGTVKVVVVVMMSLGVAGNAVAAAPVSASTTNASSMRVPLPYSLPVRSWTAAIADPFGVVPANVATSTAGTPQDLNGAGTNAAELPQVVAITPNGQYAYVLGNSNAVYPYDIATNTFGSPISLPIPAGVNSDDLVAIAITPDGQYAYVADYSNNVVVPIDLTTAQAGNAIPLGTSQGSPISNPIGIAITPDGNTVWVNASGNGTQVLVPIATATNIAGPSIVIDGYPGAEAMAITPDGKTAYAVNSQDGVVSVSLATGTVGTVIPLGNTVPMGIAITPDGTTAWVTESQGGNGNGAVVPIDLVTDTAGTPITDPSMATPIGVTVAPDGQSVYVGNYNVTAGGSGDNYVTIISTATKTVAATIDMSSLGEKEGSSIAITPDQAPIARLAANPAPAGQATSFDASASTVAVGNIVSYAWNFGDGSVATTTSPTTSHVYTVAQTYKASVTETDSAGTSTTQVFTGTTVSLNGGPSAVASTSFAVPASGPDVSSVSPDFGPTVGGTSVTISGSGFASGAAVTFGLTPAAGVNVVSTTEITATSPAGTGTVDIRVSVSGLQSPANAGDRFAYVSPPAPYHPLTPARICDTRAGNPSGLSGGAAQCNGNSLVGGVPRSITVAGLGGVPTSGATAAVLNVTVTDPSNAGYLTVYPAGQNPPTASNLNFTRGETVPNLVEVVLPSSGQVSIVTNATSADAIVDVEGYVGPASAGSTAGLYNPLPPSRICDTRAGNPSGLSGGAAQCNGQSIQSGVARDVNVAGLGGVPSTGVEAVVLNVTVTDPSSVGFLTAYPAGRNRPTASNLNFTRGETVPNRVIVPVGSAGQVALYANTGSLNVIVDVGGWYTDGSGLSSGSLPFTAMAPSRICDTRTGSGEPYAGNTLGPGGVLVVQVAGVGGVPAVGSSSPPTAVVINITATRVSSGSYLTAYPDGTSRPTASDLNLSAGRTVPNLVVVKLGGDGAIDVYNFAGSTDVIIDVVGWYS